MILTKQLTRYLIPLIAVGAASVFAFAMLRTVGPNPAISYAYLCAIMAAAWWGGYGPGLLACALSFFLAPHLLVPRFSVARTDFNRLALTALVSLLISRVSAVRRRAEGALRRANEELEMHVRERTAELEQANRALAQKAAELQRSNADLEQYAYAASHDLQEPLRIVNIYAQLLARRYEGHLDSTARDYIRFITSGSRRMHDLVNDLLSYSRVISDEQRFTACPVEEVVAEAVAKCRVMLTEADASVAYDGLPDVRGNREHLVKLFQNLIDNAVRYRNPNQPPRIHIEASRSDEQWQFCVHDNGIGIDMQYADYIFQLFKRLHGADMPGTGIGLAVCKQIIEQHGGRIWVESASGRGSTFKFTLPAASLAEPLQTHAEDLQTSCQNVCGRLALFPPVSAPGQQVVLLRSSESV